MYGANVWVLEFFSQSFLFSFVFFTNVQIEELEEHIKRYNMYYEPD